MTSSLGDYDIAIEVREVIQRIVAAEVNKLRPQYVYATVTSIDLVNDTVSVVYPGDTLPVKVSVRQIAPVSAGQIVRIAGNPGDKYIDDVVTGPVQLLNNTTIPDLVVTNGIGATDIQTSTLHILSLLTADYAMKMGGRLLGIGFKDYVWRNTSVNLSQTLGVETTLLTLPTQNYTNGAYYAFLGWARMQPGTAPGTFDLRVKNGATTIGAASVRCETAGGAGGTTCIVPSVINSLSGSLSISFVASQTSGSVVTASQASLPGTGTITLVVFEMSGG